MAAQKAGKIRYIGFTGHKDPDIHLAMLERPSNGFPFDTVQMPLNVMDAHYKSFEKKVLPVLQKHDIGVLGMKSLGSGDILKSKVVTPIECLHYAMSLPDLRRHHRLRLHADPQPGAHRRAQLPSHAARGHDRSAREDRRRRCRR